MESVDEFAARMQALQRASKPTVEERIQERRADKGFQDRLRRAIERNRAALKLLAK